MRCTRSCAGIIFYILDGGKFAFVLNFGSAEGELIVDIVEVQRWKVRDLEGKCRMQNLLGFHCKPTNSNMQLPDPSSVLASNTTDSSANIKSQASTRLQLPY